MEEVLAFSQSSLLLMPQFRVGTSSRGQFHVARSQPSPALTSRMHLFSTKLATFPTIHSHQKQFPWGIKAGVVSDSNLPTTFTVDSAGQGIDILPDSGGSNDNFGGPSGNGGDRGDNNNDKGGSDESEEQRGGSKKGMSMSQKLTLSFAALIGIGGVMGYLKGGSQKSLIAGGLSATLLYYVYTILPSNPVLASSVGLGLSASLLGIMGSRFMKSGKIFPAGIVSFASLVMSGGYLHGILRSLH